MNKFRWILLGFLILLVSPICAAKKDKVFTVVIDAGHGGKDPGAVSSSSKEKNINLAVALLLGELIEKKHPDVHVIYTRKKDVFIELDNRAKIANNAKADLFISIHTNYFKRGDVSGVETFTLGLRRSAENLDVVKRENSVILLEDNYQQVYEGFDPNSSESYIIFELIQNKYLNQSITFASNIQKQLVQKGKRADRGVRQDAFLVLRKTAMPSVLVELGYISNKKEEKYMNSDAGRQNLARCIYNAFCQFKESHDLNSGLTTAGIQKNETKQLPLLEIEEKDEPEDEPVASPDSQVEQKVQTPKASGTVYKIQLLASSVKLSPRSSQLKGYKPVDFYMEKGLYKYTYGEFSTLKEASKARKSLLKDFKTAFIIVFKNGEKVATK